MGCHGCGARQPGRREGAELDAPDPGPDACRAERADWMQRYDPEVITARYLSLVQEVIEEADAKRNEI